MIKLYIPNTANTSIGGGFTFLRNLRKGLEGKVEFVSKWQDADIVLVFSVTTMDKGEVHAAVNAGKKLVLRVDNIPRRSRNRRMHPAERLTEFGNKASLVIYQSKWCKKFARYFIKNENERIINNGVDIEIFNRGGREHPYKKELYINQGENFTKKYLYINYNDNPNKRFDEAIYRFEMAWRKDNERTLTIAGNAPSIYVDNPQYNWDLNVPAKVEYVGIIESLEETAKLMRAHDVLLYPSFCEAYPNTVLEAMACGMYISNINDEGGTKEAFSKNFYGSKTIQEMADEYLKTFNDLLKPVEN